MRLDATPPAHPDPLRDKPSSYLLWALVFCLLASPIHEIGHWVGFTLCGVPAGVSFNHTFWLRAWRPCLLGDLGGPILSLLLVGLGLLLSRSPRWRALGAPLTFFMALTRLVPYLLCLTLPGVRMAVNDEGVAAGLVGVPLWTFALLFGFLLMGSLLLTWRRLPQSPRTRALMYAGGLVMYLGLSIFGEAMIADPRLFPRAQARELVMPAN
jgi:hypothetical protein